MARVFNVEVFIIFRQVFRFLFDFALFGDYEDVNVNKTLNLYKNKRFYRLVKSYFLSNDCALAL